MCHSWMTLEISLKEKVKFKLEGFEKGEGLKEEVYLKEENLKSNSYDVLGPRHQEKKLD